MTRKQGKGKLKKEMRERKHDDGQGHPKRNDRKQRKS